jgi:high-affinity iron transporter
MLANYLIGIREGLEAALVVGILIAYLHKLGQSAKVRVIWYGVFSAIAVAATVGTILTFSSFELSESAQEILAGILSLTAAGLITWMILWLAQKSRHLRKELETGVDKAVVTGSASLFTLAFLAVGREGLETAVFIWNAIMQTKETATPVAGTFLGIFTSVFLGWALYKGSLKINIGKFFRYSGAALVVVAAGMFSYAIHDLQEGGIIPGAENIAYDITSWISPDGVLGTVLGGSVNFSTHPTQLQVFFWFIYFIPVAYLFLQQSRQSAVKAK